MRWSFPPLILSRFSLSFFLYLSWLVLCERPRSVVWCLLFIVENACPILFQIFSFSLSFLPPSFPSSFLSFVSFWYSHYSSDMFCNCPTVFEYSFPLFSLFSFWFNFCSLKYWHFTFTFHFLALEKEMATHCSVLAWRIRGTGEPGGLPSMGSHSVGHDWSDLAVAASWLSLSLAMLMRL